ncbi:MAG: LysR family transcriptional regulator [Alphaproteobacteria bacterium]|nr:LysR family transcriptional regulator [Alphaproteobacteria bacterium]
MGRLADIEIFAAVVEHGSFTHAGKALGLSKSYVSKRIRALEDHVGAPLLTRNSRHVNLTPAGTSFHGHCAAALELLAAGEAELASEQQHPRGLLRVTFPIAFGLDYLTEPLGAFAVAHPELEVRASYTDRRVDLVAEAYDLGIRVANLPDSDLVARRLATTEMWLVASPAYLERHGEPHTLEELVTHEGLLYEHLADPFRWAVPGPDGPTSVRMRGRFRADSGDALGVAARAGVGIAVLPDWMVGPDVARGALRRLLAHLQAPTLGIWAVHPPQRHVQPKVAQLVRTLAEALDPPPWLREGSVLAHA